MTEDFCKLASGIILSTIWRASDHTRILWITMLALKDREHRVYASVPGLAAVANIPLESVRTSLAELLAPDPDSRCKVLDGRRLQEIEGGWFVINGEKYRNYLSRAERTEYQAKLMASRRAKEKMLAPVSKKLAPLGQAEAEAEAKKSTLVESPKEIELKLTPEPANPKADPAEQIYQAYPRKVGKLDALKEIRKALKTVPFDELLRATEQYAKAWKDASDKGFCPYPATWFHKGRYLDDPTTWQDCKPKQTVEQIEYQIDVHPANPTFVRYNPNCTEAQKQELDGLRKKLYEARSGHLQ